MLEQPCFRRRLLVGICESNTSGWFLRSEVCYLLIEHFRSAKKVNESIPETCQQICIPHLFPLGLLAESHLCDEEPSATCSTFRLWVFSQPMLLMQARAGVFGDVHPLSPSRCASVGTQMGRQSHHVLQCVHEPGRVVQQPSSLSPVVWAKLVSQWLWERVEMICTGHWSCDFRWLK